MPPQEERSADRAALDPLHRLYEQEYARLLTFVRWRSAPALAARRDPEDILQAAFLRARQRWDDFGRSGMAFYPWLCRIVLDCLFDDHDFHARRQRDYRSEQAWPDQSSLQEALGLHAPGTSPSVLLGRKELRERIDFVLGLLSPEHQEIMVLVHFAELSKGQAADVLGVEAGTARQRYARARAKFREIWKDHFGQDGLG